MKDYIVICYGEKQERSVGIFAAKNETAAKIIGEGLTLLIYSPITKVKAAEVNSATVNEYEKYLKIKRSKVK